MKLLHLESTGGASGDMLLAALCALGADPGVLTERIQRAGVEPFVIELETVKRQGILGVQVHVQVPAMEMPERHLADIEVLLQQSGLQPRAKELAGRAFSRLAEAEAQVHGCSPQQVHFHEVGALDSIVDIFASCQAFIDLGIEEVTLSPLPLGRGTTQSRHGVIPVPAPATLALLHGWPVEYTTEPYELVTPSAAALLTTWCRSPGRAPHGTIQAHATVWGHRELDHRPNLLRAILFECPAHESAQASCIKLETNLDDMTPELVGALTESLFAAGALDVFTTPVYMKKQRPGILLTILCADDHRDTLVDLLFRESTTFGIRECRLQRTCLPRTETTVATPYGPVRVKTGTWHEKEVTRSPEYSDCVRCAKEHSVPVKAVYEAARHSMQSQSRPA